MDRKLGPFDTVGISGREYNRLAEEINTLRAELAALKKAAKALIADVHDYVHCSNIDESRDALAALVGEE